MKLLSISTLLLATAGVSATQSLTPESFNDFRASGANGMVKFFQSWCGHCMRMKPDWDRLADEAPSGVVIADVDCGEQEDLCQQNEVRGYPTIKYYVDGKEHDYDGGRSFEELDGFVSEELAAKCTFSNLESCSEKAKKYIEKWSAKSADERKKEVDRLMGMENSGMKSDLKKWLKERQKILNSGMDEL